jgi:hypothetical protein
MGVGPSLVVQIGYCSRIVYLQTNHLVDLIIHKRLQGKEGCLEFQDVYVILELVGIPPSSGPKFPPGCSPAYFGSI